MTISYLLAPMPKWYIADLTGKPLGAGSMYTYRSLDKTSFKLVYQDPAGAFAWTDPILFDENGSQGPFYWEVDSTALQETYYIEVYDSSGVLQWTIDDFAPPGSGGGSIITTALDLQNLVINGVFWRNVGTTANPIGVTKLKIAPGANTGLAETASNAGPDIQFIKNNTAAADQISFPAFTLGSNALTGDVTPVNYMKYACGNSPAGETYKYVQFPITSGVQNLSNQDVILTIWARCNSGNNQLLLQWMQFFGDGAGASPALTTPIQTLTLTAAWTKYQITVTVPDVTAKTLGGCGNDGLFLQVQYPLGAATDIDIVKPSVYLGDVTPEQDYITYDMIDGQLDTARTGDVRTSINSFYPFGWVQCNDGTVGNASSGASNRANIDTFPLFNFLWGINSTYTPMYSSAGVPTARGATSIADFTANNRISLTAMLGRVIAGCAPSVSASQTFTVNTGVSTTLLTVADATLYSPGTPVQLSNSGGALPAGLSNTVVYYPIIVSATTMRLSLLPFDSSSPVAFSDNGTGTQSIVAINNALGLGVGENKHTMTVAEIAAHTHDVLPGGYYATGGASGSGVQTFKNAPPAPAAQTGSTGSSTPFNVMQPSVYINVFMKL